MNRFFTTSDKKQTNVIFELEPILWWSRVLEYPFVLDLMDKNDLVLDVGTGVPHPLKFALVSKCKKVYACDVDDMSKGNILEEIKRVFGQEFDENLIDMVEFTQCNSAKLEYKDKTFSKIVSISVLEHMTEKDIELTFSEMKRVLKDNGKIIITCDYPTITPEALMQIVKKANLKIDGEYDYAIPENAIQSDSFGNNLKCYSMVLIKT